MGDPLKIVALGNFFAASGVWHIQEMRNYPRQVPADGDRSCVWPWHVNERILR